MHIYNQPTKLIKECILEVLQENLLNEGFDPLSQGPNEVSDNPYPAWNEMMRRLEESGEDNLEEMYLSNDFKKEADYFIENSGLTYPERVAVRLYMELGSIPKMVQRVIDSGYDIKDYTKKQYSEKLRRILNHAQEKLKYNKTRHREGIEIDFSYFEKNFWPKGVYKNYYEALSRMGLELPLKLKLENHPHGRYAQQAGAGPFLSPHDY